MGIRDLIGVGSRPADGPQSVNGSELEPEVKQEPVVKMVPKKVQCPRCMGDGFWHTSRTGYRLETIGDGILTDTSRVCQQCKGLGKITIKITEEQAAVEANATKQRKYAEVVAKDARKKVDAAEKSAVRAEARVKH